MTAFSWLSEWQGLNGPDYLDVVESTKEARETYPDFPVNMFILEDLGFDGILILLDSNGSVFEWQYGSCKKIYSTILEYLDECLERKN
ncbi:SMI1/KNR4 family protein [Streptococcus sp. DD11]|uniref:hypothetical protein n=1 Tax=Streptococcus sp. DD11 TaxID=1777879 RepID=UPI000797FAA3|nr:hypothetical protein [Streptococcus sp. DD11]KXT81416.1 SMI1/KNR4 family protein [Streptococcus sp. DD11]